jgi:hypothetical protein
MMIYTGLFVVFILILIVILLAFLLWRYSSGGKSQAAEVKGVDITGDSNSTLRKWDCSSNNRQLVFSGVPAGLTPYLVPINESELRSQEKEGFKILLSIAGDVRFRNSEGREIGDFASTVTVWLSYNAQDVLALRKTDYKISDLVPVKIVPGQTNWKPFPAKKIDYSNLNCGEFGGVFISVDSWGDPPIGWGSPKGS